MRLFFVLFLFLPIIGSSQTYFRIDSILVYDIIETEPDNEIYEGFGEGPSVRGYFTLINYTEDTFIFTQPYCKICFFYEYGLEELSGLFLYASIPDSLRQLLPGDSICLDGGSSLMLDVSLHKSKRLNDYSFRIIDHTDVFFRILPTLYAKLLITDDEFVSSATCNWIEVDPYYRSKVMKLITQDCHRLNNK